MDSLPLSPLAEPSEQYTLCVWVVAVNVAQVVRIAGEVRLSMPILSARLAVKTPVGDTGCTLGSHTVHSREPLESI